MTRALRGLGLAILLLGAATSALAQTPAPRGNVLPRRPIGHLRQPLRTRDGCS
jgi:hypothetical protein